MDIDSIMRLKTRWMNLFRGKSGVDPSFLEVEFERLVACYSEKHRRYHTLRHISDCLFLLDQFDFLAKRKLEIELAIWYHDVVYDTKSNKQGEKSNEEKSADMFFDFAELLNYDIEMLYRIYWMIRASSHGKLDEPISPDTLLFLDIDLSILGADDLIYDDYDRNIRMEYSWVPEDEYIRGRTHVLQSFIGKAFIYRTQLKDVLEDKARSNIKRSLLALSSGKTSC